MDLENAGKQVVGIITAIIGVAIIAVILSNGSNTVNVLGVFFQGLSGLLGTVISPVTGGNNFVTGTNSSTGQSSVYAGQVTLGTLPGSYGYTYSNPYGGSVYGGSTASLNLGIANQALGTLNNAVGTAGNVYNFAAGLGGGSGATGLTSDPQGDYSGATGFG